MKPEDCRAAEAQDAKNTAERVVHPIPPVCGPDARILILGSFPSVKSREARFFYGHPRNRFQRLLYDLALGYRATASGRSWRPSLTTASRRRSRSAGISCSATGLPPGM